jgi:hypothetical protein
LGRGEQAIPGQVALSITAATDNLLDEEPVEIALEKVSEDICMGPGGEACLPEEQVKLLMASLDCLSWIFNYHMKVWYFLFSLLKGSTLNPSCHQS